jgi:hypothetical protein
METDLFKECFQLEIFTSQKEGVQKLSKTHKRPPARKSLVKGERFSRMNAEEPEIHNSFLVKRHDQKFLPDDKFERDARQRGNSYFVLLK